MIWAEPQQCSQRPVACVPLGGISCGHSFWTWEIHQEMWRLQGECSSGSGRRAGVVWSVGLLVFYRPLEVTFILSVGSCMSGHCVPRLRHCWSDQTHEGAEQLHWAAFSQTGLSPSRSTFLSNKVSDLCSHVDVLELSLTYPCDCTCARGGLVFPCFTGDRQGMNWLVICVCAILQCSARLCLRAFQKLWGRGLVVCFVLCLEDSRANCCSHLTAENFAFAHFV